MGENLPRSSVKSLKDPSYVMHLYYHSVIDGRTGWKAPEGLGRFINCCPVGEKNNVKTVPVPVDLKDGLKAKKIVTNREITRGEEFFINYSK